MKIGAIIKLSQSGMDSQLNKKNNEQNSNQKQSKDNSLSFHDIEQLMKHDSYVRGKGGAIRQVKHE